MKAEQIIAILQLLSEAAVRLKAIAKDDPEVWEQIKADFNKTSDQFKEGLQ